MRCDFLIIGGGIMGLAVARALKRRHPRASIALIEKEKDVAYHASGRNSGVLHAGFYYGADSLKAKFCRDGNKMLTAYVKEHRLKYNHSQKLVVAYDAEEEEGLRELKRRGDKNGVKVELINEQQAAAIEPNARTHGHALYSPTTATVDPVEVCNHLRDGLRASGVQFFFEHPYRLRLEGNHVLAGLSRFEAGKIINCAGLYADKVARDFGFCRDYTIIPFKGVYLTYSGTNPPAKINLYPVPNLKNPFLGVHFGIKPDGSVKIGPTAIPAFWRENYGGLSGLKPWECLNIVSWEAALFARDSFGFRHLAIEELKKYRKSHLIALAARMVKQMDAEEFRQWSRPGIRAQLLNTKTMALVQDFIVEGDASSVHVLNAVSPAFTSSLPFGEWIVEKWI